jgi:heme oxygenase
VAAGDTGNAAGGKCNWLMLDLRQGGLSDAAIKSLPVSGFRPDLHSVATRFGAAYVIEGAQFGTQVLRKRLGPTLAPWTPRWLETYGNDTATNWRTFVSCMQNTLDSEASRAEAAGSAPETFSSLATWFRMQSLA